MDDDQQSSLPQPATAPPAPERPRRGRLLLAAVSATALVAGLGGAGAGYALAHGRTGGSAQPSSPGSQQRTTFGGSGAPGGTITIPGSGGDWSWSDGGQGGITAPVKPYGGAQSPQTQEQSGDTTTRASGPQLTGLVRVVTTMRYDAGKAAGTGMVLTSDGEVVTNHHVVDGATSIKVKVMATGRTYTARVVGTDTKDDVAVLRLAGASGLSTVTPDTDGISVGAAVTAVGDANGTVNQLSAATGTVLAKNQTITTQSEGAASGETLTGLLQISSDVISGDSGGATYDAAGKVVGMTTAASSGSSDVVGYAVPVAKVLRIVHDLDSGVTSSRYAYGYPAFLGVALGDTGTTVQGVFTGTPAARAGIRAGDEITAVGSTRVSTPTRLRAAVAGHSPGDRVSITWTGSDGTSQTATVTLAQGPVE